MSRRLGGGPAVPPRARAGPVAARWAAHACAWLVVWPVFAAVVAPTMLVTNPLFKDVDPAALGWGAAVSALEMWREFLAVGALLALVTAAAAAAGGWRAAATRREAFLTGIAEAFLVGTALLFGLALELPAALRHPALLFAAGAPVWVVTGVLGAIAVVVLPVARGREARSAAVGARWAVIAAATAALAWSAVRFPPEGARTAAKSDVRLVLGIDSLSRVQPLDALRAFAAEEGGTWYERAVTPGLLTNSVWWSIATSRWPSDIGVFFTFQAPDWRKLPENVVVRAKAAGLRTYGFFPDQFTTHIGSDLPFDEKRSGPRGWKQVTTAAVKDASFWLPVVLPWLPRLPGAATPANQGGTFAYSVRRELTEVFTAGADGSRALILAHIGHLHQPRYPGYSELTPAERAAVFRAPLRTIRDLSLHPMYPEVPGAPLDVHAFKLRRLQEQVVAVARETGFLAPSRRNRLVLFSDHGDRSGLDPVRFGEEAWYGVPLATFGIPGRDPRRPISLVEIPALIGLAPPATPAARDPRVEFTGPTRDDMVVLAGRIGSDGAVIIDPATLARVGARLRAYHPYGTPPRYVDRPAVPADVRAEDAWDSQPGRSPGRRRGAGGELAAPVAAELLGR